MPYGLSISPSVFQTFMNEVFREFLHRFVIVYIDDILIYSRNMAEHRHHVQQVLHKLREFRLYLKLEKCEFHRPSVHFLGHIISAEGVQMDQGKVSAIQEGDYQYWGEKPKINGQRCSPSGPSHEETLLGGAPPPKTRTRPTVSQTSCLPQNFNQRTRLHHPANAQDITSNDHGLPTNQQPWGTPFCNDVIKGNPLTQRQRKYNLQILAELDWPQPLTVKELQRFLGFANFYRRFIKDYSTITAPLTSLLRGKPRSISWNPSAHEAFLHLKKIFSTAPLLHHPDPELPFTVEVDASTTGVGAVLSQAVGEPPLLHPCAFYSRKLSPAEQNYDVGNRELLAIKLALEEWRHWLEGSNHPFTIITDHKNLQYIQHLGGRSIPTPFPEQSVEPESIVPSNLIISPIVWEIDEDIRNATLQEAAPPECPEGKIYVPLALRQTLLDTAHRSPGSGHPGSQRTLSLVQSRYWWPSMRRDTIRYVQSCSVCAMSTSPRQLPTGKLVPLPIPQRPWSHIGVDFVTDLPAAEGNTCILVMVDRVYLRRWRLPRPYSNSSSATSACPRRSCRTGDLNSSRTYGKPFSNYLVSQLTCLLDITHRPTARQRKIQELGRYLRAYCHKDQHCWNRFLPWAEYAQNSLRQDTTGLTPFQCVLGYQPPLFPWTEEPSNVPAVDHWFRESERVWDSAHIHLQRAVQQHKRFADVRRRPAPNSTQGTWCGCPHGISASVNPVILRRINEVTFQLQLPPRYRIHPTFHVSLLKPYHPSVTEPPGAEVEPPPLEILEPPSVYTVHEILGSRRPGPGWNISSTGRDQPAPRGRGRPRRRVGASGAAPGGGGSVRHSPQPPSSDTHPVAPPTRSQSPEF
ncbi:Transposon Ty3-I Gag-Pol polyprotein [Labeo rohita]|uniref:Gypsy retrotransposon integrase-like protein 1 n=1 Tax=Labeo rohita TaxID=84645 RepID=A0ABQ8L5M9_LABRO|nr:Transposon Ty3-I Gag-Pol polyprotein [Labeo rohita]